jgi:hypothetical protein
MINKRNKKADMEELVKYLIWIVFFIILLGGIYGLKKFFLG